MSILKTVGLAVVITSALGCADIEKAKRFAADSTKLLNEKKEPIFAVTVGESIALSKNGVQFSDDNAEGKAQLTVMVPEFTGISNEEKAELIKWEFAPILANINKVEAQILAETAAIDATLTETMASVVIE